MRVAVLHAPIGHESRMLRQALAELAGTHDLDAGLRHERSGAGHPLALAALHEAEHFQHAIRHFAHREFLSARLLD